MVRFLVLAADGCYEFSWSPCGLTLGCTRLLGVEQKRKGMTRRRRRKAPARLEPLARPAPVSFSFSFGARSAEPSIERQKEQAKERENAMCENVTHGPKIPVSFNCAKHPAGRSVETRSDSR